VPEATRIRSLFAKVAPRYDFLNHLLSLGIDRSWRRQAVAALSLGPKELLLDLCCGTGDLALAAAPRARVVGCDFTWEMLVRARSKSIQAGLPLALAAGDALRLPFAEGAFDSVSVAFGLRNLEDPRAGLREMRRVLRSGGRLAVLEFSHPTHFLLKMPYWVYLNGLLPVVGRLISRRREAYRYLADSIGSFPAPEVLSTLLEEEGFREPRFRLLSGGIVAVHQAVR
jgi:demethylmenaquinone methyltransferase/2-methoxy-6-polyprenyl-1,4-benzoquinol methylase